tara:strand:+ start:1619 stop:1897 length:279 start_codon:yes stop_codon:yes gene_type:complete
MKYICSICNKVVARIIERKNAYECISCTTEKYGSPKYKVTIKWDEANVFGGKENEIFTFETKHEAKIFVAGFEHGLGWSEVDAEIKEFYEKS